MDNIGNSHKNAFSTAWGEIGHSGDVCVRVRALKSLQRLVAKVAGMRLRSAVSPNNN